MVYYKLDFAPNTCIVHCTLPTTKENIKTTANYARG